MKVFIIGASGSIGWPLFNYLSNTFSVFGTYNKTKKKKLIQFSLQSKKNQKQLTKMMFPNDVVIILSAETNVKWVHENPNKSYKVNTALTNDFIKILIKKNIRIIYLSSAEVFNGKKGFYKENAKPLPVNTYGKTKYFVEKFLKKTRYDKYHIIRTGRNVNMSNDYRCMIKDTYLTLLKKDPKMAFDNLFTITHMDDFNIAIKKLISSKIKDKILHISSSEVLSRIQFADLIIKFSKLKKRMKYRSVKFKDIGYSEPRACKNNIDNRLTKKLLKLNFRKSSIIIKEKVKLLDKIYAKHYSK